MHSIWNLTLLKDFSLVLFVWIKRDPPVTWGFFTFVPWKKSDSLSTSFCLSFWVANFFPVVRNWFCLVFRPRGWNRSSLYELPCHGHPCCCYCHCCGHPLPPWKKHLPTTCVNQRLLPRWKDDHGMQRGLVAEFECMEYILAQCPLIFHCKTQKALEVSEPTTYRQSSWQNWRPSKWKTKTKTEYITFCAYLAMHRALCQRSKWANNGRSHNRSIFCFLFHGVHAALLFTMRMCDAQNGSYPMCS